MTSPNMKNDQQPLGTMPLQKRLSRFRTWLKQHASFQWIISFLFLTITLKSKKARIIAASLAILVLLGWIFKPAFIDKWKESHKEFSIAVFVPDEKLASQSAFYQDGVVQKRGFNAANLDADKFPNKLKVSFYDMKFDDTPIQLLNEMKERYAKEGATYFVMTMSGKVLGVCKLFKDWHDKCVHHGKREPILIATVASAPNIADASSGILRWYVRSEEESSLLAIYLRWNMAIDRVGVFYINDAYGNRGMEVFQNRFKSSLGGLSVEPFPVTAMSAKTEVQAFLAKYRSGTGQNNEHTGVFIVGYGDMVRETLNELIAQGFDGPIACTSTLTEPDWQPKNTIADNRIVTVLPRLSKPLAKLCGDDRNIVFFFAKETLRCVLELTAKDSNPRVFIESWKQDDTKSGLDQECLANGDTIIQLDVIGVEQWR